MPFKQEEKAMRMTVPLILAAALAAATPALAQDANNTAAVDVNATVPDATAVDANAAAPVATNDLAVAPAEPVATDVATTEPAPEKKGGGFPWGVLGLLGLVGLFPRKGR
jgi:hypothetical protein